MLEYWYKEKRTLVDFRRGPLCPHFDDFAAYLRARKYSLDWGRQVLGKCCQFNGFLIDQGIKTSREITESLIDPFLAAYLLETQNGGTSHSPRDAAS